MKLKCFSIGTLGLLAVSGLAWSCSNKAEDCDANLNCGPYGGGAPGTSGASGLSGASGTGGAGGTSGTSGEGGTDPSSAGSGGAPPPPCDGSLSPDMDACVISDEYGIFVSPDGDDASADGTQAHPFAKLTSALGSESIANKHVYVCAADYAEPGILEIPDRVSIYGGFSCDGGNWKYDSPFPAHLLPASAIGAMITDAKVGVVLQDVRLDAQNAPDGTGANSFGLMIIRSQNIVLKRVEIRAGKGGKGSTGADGPTGLDGIASGADQNGEAGTCSSPPFSRIGSQAITQQCGSQGGAGGTAQAAVSYSPIQDGAGGYPVTSSNGGGKGGEALGQNAKPGQPGDNGARGDLGLAAPAVGEFSEAGYNVASGGSGGPGKPGAGGGGGGASLGSTTCLGATGGAGGMGGCGGDPGAGGGGGGASVALFSWQSSVSLDGCNLTASTGGAGGNGGNAHAGGAGKPGGMGGGTDKDNTVGAGGDGLRGGSGGNGGNGAGGTGGPAIALSWSGTKPIQMGDCHLNVGEGGKPGLGGRLGSDSTKWGPDGQAGIAEVVFPKETP